MRNLFVILMIAILAGTGLGAGAQEVYVDNVVIVLDASGSMNDRMSGTSIRKIEAAKSAIKEVVKNTPPTTQIGLLVFGEYRRWEYPLGPRDDEKLFRAIDSVSATGGTPLGEFIKKGADRLLKARKDQFGYGSYRLLVVTDGEASDQNMVQRYTPDVISRGITVDVIGVDMQQDHTLAKTVHSYRRANDPASLSQAIREVFAEVGSASDGLSGDAAFEELQGLPTEAASAIITSLATTGNEPIGSQLGSRPGPVPQPRQTNGSTSQSRPSKKHKNGNFIFVVIIAIIGINVISKLMRKG